MESSTAFVSTRQRAPPAATPGLCFALDCTLSLLPRRRSPRPFAASVLRAVLAPLVLFEVPSSPHHSDQYTWMPHRYYMHAASRSDRGEGNAPASPPAARMVRARRFCSTSASSPHH
eukprot:COSAG05_NODE_1910_length_3845_cov_2.662306_4_plen_117_part_00